MSTTDSTAPDNKVGQLSSMILTDLQGKFFVHHKDLKLQLDGFFVHSCWYLSILKTQIVENF